MKKENYLISVLFLTLFLAGCSHAVQQQTDSDLDSEGDSAFSREQALAFDSCFKKCNEELASGKNLDKGPCLLDPIPETPEWVCDVAHSPRKDVDNLPENQCSAFREGKAKYFIELSPDCKFIRDSSIVLVSK